MDVYSLARIKSRYAADLASRYSEKVYPADSLLQWPSGGYFRPWERERQLLSEALVQPPVASESLADQVFGREAQQEKLHVAHEAGLIAHRYQLHKQHLRDINHTIMRLQERLSIERMFFPGPGQKQQVDLEKLLANLEAQKRDEDIAFWKDTLKLRQEIFSGAREYQAARHRASVLKGLEVEDG
jgi:DNA primase